MIQQIELLCAACACNLGTLTWMGLLGEARDKHRQDLGGSVKLTFTHLSREAKVAIVFPNRPTEADFASLAVGPDHTLYISSVRTRKKGCKLASKPWT